MMCIFFLKLMVEIFVNSIYFMKNKILSDGFMNLERGGKLGDKNVFFLY